MTTSNDSTSSWRPFGAGRATHTHTQASHSIRGAFHRHLLVSCPPCLSQLVPNLRPRLSATQRMKDVHHHRCCWPTSKMKLQPDVSLYIFEKKLKIHIEFLKYFPVSCYIYIVVFIKIQTKKMINIHLIFFQMRKSLISNERAATSDSIFDFRIVCWAVETTVFARACVCINTHAI